MDNPFLALKSQWLEKIAQGLKSKSGFQKVADECMAYFSGPYDFMYKLSSHSNGDFVYNGPDSDFPRPTFGMTINKASECTQLFGPVLYHKNPSRLVTPRQQPKIDPTIFGNPQDPMVQYMMAPFMQELTQSNQLDAQRGELIQHYLKFIPGAIDQKNESRQAIDECMIKGMGVRWSEIYQPPGASWKMVGSFYDTVDNLVVDPDYENMKAIFWCARKRTAPVWEVEAKFGLIPGSLDAEAESMTAAGVTGVEAHAYKKNRGDTNDLITYWELWSKMGMGALLSGIDDASMEWDRFGRYCYLVVTEGCEYPLNLPPSVWDNDQEIKKRVAWPIPFWIGDGWPFTDYVFHRAPRQQWPTAHLKPVLGQLQFINWCYSFLAGRIHRECVDYIAIRKGASQTLKDAIMSGRDYQLIEIEKEYGTISEVVQFLQHPQMNGDILKVLLHVEESFMKGTGLTELMYGSTQSSFRSAEEANLKGSQLRIRPDDMATRVEESESEVAWKEALAARWCLDQQDLVPALGKAGAMLWQKLVATHDPSQLVHNLEFRVEAGSIRKPNYEKMAQDAQNAMTALFPTFTQFAMTAQIGGPEQVRQVNALLSMWAKANQLDPEPFLFPVPPPPQPQPDPEQQQQQNDAAAAKQDLVHKEIAHRQAIQHSQQKHEQKQAKEKAA